MSASIIYMTKECRQCKVNKETALFSRNRKTKDGYRYACKECEKANAQKYYAENKDTVKTTVGKWQKDHPDDIQRYKSKYYALKNPQPAEIPVDKT